LLLAENLEDLGAGTGVIADDFMAGFLFEFVD
jgi:hypothetical protein